MKQVFCCLRSLHIMSKARRNFFCDEEGSATAEAVIWMPVFIMLLGLIVDTSMIFSGQAQALRVIQDANRSLSIGRIMTTGDAESFILNNLIALSPRVTVSTKVIDGMIISTAIIPASDLGSVGILPAFESIDIHVIAQHMSEI